LFSQEQGPEHFFEVNISVLVFSTRGPNDLIAKWKRAFSRSHFVTESIAAVFPIMLMTVIRQRPQELYQIALFRGTQTQALTAVIVIYYIQQRGESSIVVEAALGMRP
jgi:hypothetical protein